MTALGRPRIVFMFSGQGSQYYQMGRELYARGGAFAAALDDAARMVDAANSESILPRLYGSHGKAEPILDIELSHPAIFTVEYAMARYLMDKCAIYPGAVMGVSLGVLTAAVVADCIKLPQAIALVTAQAQWLRDHGRPGGMIAVLGAPRPARRSCSTLAARNGPAHFVLSAPQERLSFVEQHLRARGAMFLRLPVAYAFHSPWLALQETAPAALKTPAWSAALPMVCCVDGTISQGFATDYFRKVTQQPVCLDLALAAAESIGPCRYLDLGPSGTLATSMRNALPAASGSTAHPTLSPYGSTVSNVATIRRLLAA